MHSFDGSSCSSHPTELGTHQCTARVHAGCRTQHCGYRREQPSCEPQQRGPWRATSWAWETGIATTC